MEGHEHRLAQGLRLQQIGQCRIVLAALGIDDPPLDIQILVGGRLFQVAVDLLQLVVLPRMGECDTGRYQQHWRQQAQAAAQPRDRDNSAATARSKPPAGRPANGLSG